jgi:uncharacterized pyridoxal phosphate-containing UPF0001 family protein
VRVGEPYSRASDRAFAIEQGSRAVELFDAVDSLDSLRLAERLNEAAGKLGKRLPVLIEVKLSSEETKAGLEPDSPRPAHCWSGCRIWLILQCAG